MTTKGVETPIPGLEKEQNTASPASGAPVQSSPTAASSTEFTAQDDAMLKSMGIAPASGKTTTSDKTQADAKNTNPWAGDIEAYQRKPWNDTARGRLAIRIASRGIMGAAFYALAQVKGGADMKYYDPSHSWSDIWNGTHLDAAHVGERKWLQLLAKAFDSTIGNTIKGTVKFITGDEVKAAESVLFRPTRFYKLKNPGLQNSNAFTLAGGAQGKDFIWGRSLGSEIVGVTFDFASMSVGDGLAREYLIPLLDPAIEKKWLKREVTHDKDGHEVVKTHLDFAEGGKSFAKAAWRLFTYNAGEDWFAGPIYAYYMKWQRNLIDRHSPGFGYDSDRALNGGSFKINSEGKITGNYNTEGMLDLMGRFSFYNFLTLMFREGYNKAGSMISNYWDTGKFGEIKTPENISEGVSDVFGGAYNAGRYLVKSFIKAYTYMIPASFVFASIRTSQSKDIGLAVHQELNAAGKLESKGPLYFMLEKNNGKSYPSYIHANGSLMGTGAKMASTFEPDSSNIPQDVLLGIKNNRVTANSHEVPNPFSFTRNDNGAIEKFPYNAQVTKKMDYATNLIGKASHGYGNVFKAITTKMAYMWKGNPSASELAANPKLATEVEGAYQSAKSYTRRFSKASLAYTPYFFAKTDVLSRNWDNERVDVALNRIIDGATSFNPGEFSAGVAEWWHALRHETFDEPSRESLVKAEIENNAKQGFNAPLSQESSDIPSGYQYMPEGRTHAQNVTRHEQHAQKDTSRSLETILAGQAAKSGSWSEKNPLKEQNAPSTGRIH